MKVIGYTLLIGLWLLNSCKPTDPQADLLIGTWQETAFRPKTNPDWKPIIQNGQATFHPDGSITSTDNNLLSGGWCNVAEGYRLKGNQLFFEFGEPKCIPFVAHEIPSEATIIALTSQLLIIEWGQVVLKFERH